MLVQGEEQWAWPVLSWAQAVGLDVRIGLEDTVTHPDGRLARADAELVEVAAATEPGAPTRRPTPDAR